MQAKNDLDSLLKNLSPTLNKGEYVFVSLTGLDRINPDDIIAQFKEEEGITLVLNKEKADELRLTYEFIAAWITLTVHSSLEAVGLTAAFSTELAKHSISCNVVAGYYHDHIFVNTKDTQKAMDVLNSLSTASKDHAGFARIERIENYTDHLYKLLELADPDKAKINSYLETGKCYGIFVESKLVGAIVLDEIDPESIEVKNIAVKKTEQGKGFGKQLLHFTDNLSRNDGYKTIIIKTANSSINQLALYQKEGFELSHIEKDYFTKNYSKPIFENGIKCRDQVVLRKKLT